MSIGPSDLLAMFLLYLLVNAVAAAVLTWVVKRVLRRWIDEEWLLLWTGLIWLACFAVLVNWPLIRESIGR